jgi:hypothetical protein
MYNKDEFKKLSLEKKYHELKSKGNFIISRYHGGHTVSLFTYNGFFVEMWKRTGLNYLDWIEVVNNDASLRAYLDSININIDELLN